MGYRTIYLVVSRDVLRFMQPVAFVHRISAETYIEHRKIADQVKITPITLYDEFDDAVAHIAQIYRSEVLARLSNEERKALGFNE